MKREQINNDWFFDDNFKPAVPKSVLKAWAVIAFIGLVFWLVIIAAIIFGLGLVF